MIEFGEASILLISSTFEFALPLVMAANVPSPATIPRVFIGLSELPRFVGM